MQAEYLRFDIVADEPTITGTMGQGLPHYSTPLFAAPCYDVFKMPVDEEDTLAFGLEEYFSQGLIELAGLLNDYGVTSEVYHFQSVEWHLRSLKDRQRRLQFTIAAVTRARESLKEDIEVQRERKEGAQQRLVATKVCSRIYEHTLAAMGDHSQKNDEQNPWWDSLCATWSLRAEPGGVEIPAEVYMQDDSICLRGEARCIWCGEQHNKEHCGDPHFRCTCQRGCDVPSTHVFYATLHRCPASAEWEGHRIRRQGQANTFRTCGSTRPVQPLPRTVQRVGTLMPSVSSQAKAAQHPRTRNRCTRN